MGCKSNPIGLMGSCFYPNPSNYNSSGSSNFCCRAPVSGRRHISPAAGLPRRREERERNGEMEREEELEREKKRKEKRRRRGKEEEEEGGKVEEEGEGKGGTVARSSDRSDPRPAAALAWPATCTHGGGGERE